MSHDPKNAIEVSLELRCADQNLMGYVSDVQIMTLTEEARIRAMHQLRQQTGYKEFLRSMIRTCSIDFHRQALDRSNVTVKVWISHIGETSYVIQHELSQNGQPLASMEAVMVPYSAERQVPIAISDNLRAALGTVSSR